MVTITPLTRPSTSPMPIARAIPATGCAPPMMSEVPNEPARPMIDPKEMSSSRVSMTMVEPMATMPKIEAWRSRISMLLRVMKVSVARDRKATHSKKTRMKP